jgi:putative ABC transport system permease protein
VFDPPPDALAVPWGFLAATAAVAIAATGAAGVLVLRALRRAPISVLHDL